MKQLFLPVILTVEDYAGHRMEVPGRAELLDGDRGSWPPPRWITWTYSEQVPEVVQTGSGVRRNAVRFSMPGPASDRRLMPNFLKQVRLVEVT